MRKGIRASLLFLLVMAGFGEAAAQSPINQPRTSAMEADLTKIKEAMLGSWESIAPELRPSASKNAGRLPQTVLSQARLQISAVRSLRARDHQFGRPLRCRTARADQDRRAHAVAAGLIRSLRARRKSTSLPMRATRSLRLRRGLPTSSTRSRRPDTRHGPSTHPRACLERLRSVRASRRGRTSWSTTSST